MNGLGGVDGGGDGAVLVGACGVLVDWLVVRCDGSWFRRECSYIAASCIGAVKRTLVALVSVARLVTGLGARLLSRGAGLASRLVVSRIAGLASTSRRVGAIAAGILTLDELPLVVGGGKAGSAGSHAHHDNQADDGDEEEAA